VLLQEKDSKDTGVINLVFVCVCVGTHTCNRTYMLKEEILDKKHTMLEYTNILLGRPTCTLCRGLRITNFKPVLFPQAQVPSVTVKFSQKYQDSMCRAFP